MGHLYGGEEFAMVLMDITAQQAQQSLLRFKEKIAAYDFPNVDQVTVSIGFTEFDKNLSMDELIKQADSALYYCKTTTRNVVHSYQELMAKELIPTVKAAKASSLEVS
jgi:diguanylate cyclase (GGDEF)-like protein